ncbi:MAG: hypothetical protein ABI770_00770 [Sphingomicrobium sp.]
MGPSASVFLLTALWQASAHVPDLVRPDDAAQRVRACGFSDAETRFDKSLEENVIEVARVATATDKQLSCAAKVSISSDHYLLMPDALRPRYSAIYGPLAKEQDLVSARAWLRQRGSLARLPRYRRGRDEAFPKQLERFCGKDARGALRSENGPHAFSPVWVERQHPNDATFQCLTNGAAAAGYELGFHGNEPFPSN